MWVPRHPVFWLLAFTLWLVVLWILSSGAQPEGIMPPFPFGDKVAHFGYFFGGSGLLTAYFFTRSSCKPCWQIIALSVILILGLIGVMDEFRQSFVPGRSGNDPFDWFADVLGATAGVWAFKATHTRFKWKS